MPSKYTQRNFQPHHFYHVYNRGAHQQNIFLDQEDYQTFTDVMAYYLEFPSGLALSQHPKFSHPEIHHQNLRPSPTYRLICYCLMPNHFHLLLHQSLPSQPNNGISAFMRRLCVTFAMYFNHKYRHSGALFQGKYKNVTVESDEQLLQLSKYIHLNPGQGIYESYPHSSYIDFLTPKSSQKSWLDPHPILGHFQMHHPHLSYQSFVADQIPPSATTSLALFDLLHSY